VKPVKRRLVHAREELERLEMLLARRPDEDASCLLCLAKAARRRAQVAEASDEALYGHAEFAVLAECFELFERVRAYALSIGAPWYVIATPPPDPDATIILPSGYYRGLVEAMPDGASGPSEELAREIKRSQFPTEPAPDSSPAIPITEEDFGDELATTPLTGVK
jgi:hypothetical protein